MNFTPFTQLISDFKGKNIPDEQIEADYNNTLNSPNNYFVAPDSWHECFYTTSKKKYAFTKSRTRKYFTYKTTI